MKKFVVLLGITCCLFLVNGCNLTKEEKTTLDEQKFKTEYESLNGEKNSSGKDYKTITIPAKNKVTYLNDQETLKFLKSGTGVLYFGFPECPWCRTAIPVLLETMASKKQENLYYFNALSIRDKKELNEDGTIVTTQEGTKAYYEILEALGKNADTYEGLNDESIKRLYFPTVVFVKDGKIIGTHTATVESQKDPYEPLSLEQKTELVSIYDNYLKELNTTMCDEAC